MRNSGDDLVTLGAEVFAYPETPWDDDYVRISDIYADAFPRENRQGLPDGFQQDVPRATFGSGSGMELRADGKATTGEVPAPAEPSSEKIAQMVAEASRGADERGHSRGLAKGTALGREEALGLVALERERLQAQAGTLLEGFAVEREQYFHLVEREAVRLALSIAARILRRETQMDPLLLTGAVRVALGQLAESTTVKLRVPLPDAALWTEAFKHMPGLRLCPLVVGDRRLEMGECRIETELGSADLGLASQLKEIERGFFDRAGVGVTRARGEGSAQESGQLGGGPIPSPQRLESREYSQGFPGVAAGEEVGRGIEIPKVGLEKIQG